MIGNIYSIHLTLPVSVLVALFVCGAAQADQNRVGHPRLIEAFTTIELSATNEAAVNRLALHGQTEVHVYELDGIQHIDAHLSEGLQADPEQSKRVVLQRFQQLSEEDRTRIQSAAMGLAKAMQYGVDRYPAIVFDGQAVVYGVTDVQSALAYYLAWRREGKR